MPVPVGAQHAAPLRRHDVTLRGTVARPRPPQGAACCAPTGQNYLDRPLGYFSVQADTQRPSNLQDGCKTGVSVLLSALYKLSRLSPASRATCVMPRARVISPRARAIPAASSEPLNRPETAFSDQPSTGVLPFETSPSVSLSHLPPIPRREREDANQTILPIRNPPRRQDRFKGVLPLPSGEGDRG